MRLRSLALSTSLVIAVAAGQPVKWDDVEIDATLPAVQFRREMERVASG
jgi:hypothetical protein